MTSGLGFLNAELFSLMLPVLFLIYAIARGARLVAGEEEAGHPRRAARRRRCPAPAWCWRRRWRW